MNIFHKPQDRPALVACVSDWHLNDITGLCPPEFRREQGATYAPGPAGMALWEAWEGFWEIIGAKKKEQRATTYAICDGDLCDFNRYSQAQLISQRREDVLMALCEVTEPMLKVADHIFVIRGTASHTEGTGGVEELGRRLGLERVVFGTHAPYYVPESAILKVTRECEFTEEEQQAILYGNAERLLQPVS